MLLPNTVVANNISLRLAYHNSQHGSVVWNEFGLRSWLLVVAIVSRAAKFISDDTVVLEFEVMITDLEYHIFIESL